MPDSEIKKILEDINPTEENPIVSLVINRFISAEQFRTSQVDKWDRIYKLYKGYREKKDFPWMSNIFTPVAFTIIETLLPRILGILFAPGFMLKLNPREESDVKPAKLVEALIKYQFTIMGTFRKFYIWIKNCLMYGTAVMKVYWRFDTTEKIVIEPEYLLGIKIGRKQVKKTVVLYDAPDIEPVDLYDFYVDPRATDINDAKWCIHRVWKDYDYLLEKQKQGYYKNVELVKPGVGELNNIAKQVRQQVNELPTGQIEEDKNKCELLEYWEDGKLFTIAQRSVVIREEHQNPYWHNKKPFVMIKDIENPHEFYGTGEIEPLEGLINERNELRNQAMDNVKTIVNKIIIANRNADIDFDRLEEDNRPGGVILTDDINTSLKYLETPSIIADLYNQDAMIIKDIQEASAVSEVTVGMPTRRAETATEITQLAQSASTRFMLKIHNIINNGVIELVKMMVQLNQQFIDKKKTVRILGEKGVEFVEIGAEEITGNYDYEPTIGVMDAGKDIRRQQLLLLANNPLFTMPNVHLSEFQKEILSEFDIKDVDRFIGEMPEVPPEGQITPGVTGRGVRAAKRERVATGVPSIGGVAGVPGPRT